MVNDKEQLEFCYILDSWYLACKGQFNGTHPLGMRKEDLKNEVCRWIQSKKFEGPKKYTDKELIQMRNNVEMFIQNHKNKPIHLIDLSHLRELLE